MKQRLAIASILALKPDVLFLDEPTAMLDPKGTKEIWNVLKEVGQEKTVIIVEHKIDHVLEFIDRIILFNEEGQIIADGPKEKILSSNKNEMRDKESGFLGVWEEFLDTTPLLRSRTPFEKKVKVLEVQNFKGYRQKEEKIRVEHLQAYSGEWIVIKGENGAGKGTLLHAFMQFIKTTGHCELVGSLIKKGKKHADLMTFVFQNPEFQFVANSVYEEIAYSLKVDNKDSREIERKVEELLDWFQLVDHRDKHPFQLSMGQKRRLSVAASIVKEQKLILLDEPTFGQDSKNTFALLEWIEELRLKGTTIIMITHDEQITNNFATRIWTIDAGKVISDEMQSMNIKTELVSV